MTNKKVKLLISSSKSLISRLDTLSKLKQLKKLKLQFYEIAPPLLYLLEGALDFSAIHKDGESYP